MMLLCLCKDSFHDDCNNFELKMKIKSHCVWSLSYRWRALNRNISHLNCSEKVHRYGPLHQNNFSWETSFHQFFHVGTIFGSCQSCRMALRPIEWGRKLTLDGSSYMKWFEGLCKFIDKNILVRLFFIYQIQSLILPWCHLQCVQKIAIQVTSLRLGKLSQWMDSIQLLFFHIRKG